MAETMFARVGRIARFLRGAGVLEDLSIATAPTAVPVIARHGLNVRTIHHVQALGHPERMALVDDLHSMTYAQADAAINRLARGLTTVGLQHGDRLILCLENRVEYMIVWFAAFRAGVSAVHASYRATSDELQYLAAHSRARAVVCSAQTADVVAELVEQLPNLGVIGLDGARPSSRTFDYPEFCENELDEFYEPPIGGSGDNVVYTSGTTGQPKGASRNFAGQGIAELSRITERLPVRTAERHLVVCPMYHSGAQVFAAMMTSLGNTLHFRSKFEPEDTVGYLSRWQIHSLFIVPTMIRRILELPQETLERHSTPALKAMVSGAASFPHPLRERAIRHFGADVIHDFYGATELGWITLIDGHEMLDRPGSVGRPLSGHRVEIIDRDGKDVPAGEVGLIFATTDQLMDGYLDEDGSGVSEGPVQPFFDRDERWITVEDLGYLDEDGYLYLAGRDRDMVISAGMNIYPVEIEQHVLAHPGVIDAAVIGVPDEQWGERLVGVLVGEVDTDALEAELRGSIASYKVPREWHFVEELPRNPTGKVLKRELQDRLS